MTPDQQKSCTYAFNTLKNVINLRTFFNTNARVELVKSLHIVNALLEEDLLSVERCIEFDRLMASMLFQLDKPFFKKFKVPLSSVLKSMSPKARMTLFRKLKDFTEDNIFSMLSNRKDSSAYIENFINRYGGEDHMNRLLPFA
jgi:hypothetical protein